MVAREVQLRLCARTEIKGADHRHCRAAALDDRRSGVCEQETVAEVGLEVMLDATDCPELLRMVKSTSGESGRDFQPSGVLPLLPN